MKKRNWIIVLGVVAVLAGGGSLAGWLAWRAAHYSERIAGSAAIPKPRGLPGPLEKGPADWPCWRGPRGDGHSLVTGIRTDWSQGLAKLWQVDFLCQGRDAVTWSAPVVQGNRLVVPGRGKGTDLVFCLDPATGALFWVGSYEAKASSGHGPGPRATPCIDEDRVYTFGRSGDLVCWNLQDGRLLWRHNVREVGGHEPLWGHGCSPLIDRDRVIVQGGGNALVVAYDKMTGALVWKSLQGEAGYATCVLLGAQQSRVLLAFHGGGLSGLDPNTGRPLWQVPWHAAYPVNATTPLVWRDTVFITSWHLRGCEALKVGATRADVLWRNTVLAAHHSDPVLCDGFLYGYSGQSDQNTGSFKCVDLAGGREKWATRDLGWGTTVGVDGHLLCMDLAGNLFLLKPSPQALAKVTEFRSALGPVTLPARTIPVVANGRLYLRYMERLVCYQLVP